MRQRMPTLLLAVTTVALLGACTPAPRGVGANSRGASSSRDVKPDTDPMEAGRPPSIGGQRAVTPILTR